MEDEKEKVEEENRTMSRENMASGNICNASISISGNQEGTPIAAGQAETNTVTHEYATTATSTQRIQSEAEYEMLRAEILQYMEEYQNLRNMMYIGTAALLGLNSAVWVNLYLFLLPLIIILPSYIIFVDYWKSVSIASLYIQMFLEKDNDGNFVGNRRWETMHNEFSAELKRKADGSICWKRHFSPLWSGMQCHKIPYITCTAFCFILYGCFVYVGQFNEKAIETKSAIIIGLFALVVSMLVFVFYRAPSTEVINEVWKQTKERLDGNLSPRRIDEAPCIAGYIRYLSGKVRGIWRKLLRKR